MKNLIELIFNFIILFTVTLITVALLTGCGTSHTEFHPAPSCTVESTNAGSVITCPDGTTTTINNGSNGLNGAGCTAIQVHHNAFWPNDGVDIVCGSTQAFVPNGHNGVNGTNGANGADGSSCSISAIQPGPGAPAGGSLLSCTNGTISLITNGIAGATGQTGAPGQTGATGPQGLPGTVIAPIQFCPSQGPTTYGHFPEYGLNIDGMIYAVYWSNTDAFLAQIVPGAYVSTSTGLACSFTINADGTISQ